jgi:chromosome segregation ATPase
MNISYTRADSIFFNFEDKLSKVYKKEILYNLINDLITSSIFYIAIAFVLVVLEAIFNFRSGVRTFFYYGFLLSLLTNITFLTVNHIFKRTGIIKAPETVFYSGKVGNAFSHVKDSLKNSLSLYKIFKNKQNKDTVFSDELIMANLEKTDENTSGTNFLDFVSFAKLKKVSITLIITIVVFALSLTIFQSSLFASLNRIVNYKYNFINNEYGIAFEITPGNMETFKGNSVNVNINITSNKETLKIDDIDFITKEVSRDGVELQSDSKSIKSQNGNYFSTTINNINNDVVYYAEYKGIKSAEYKISIAEYPIIKNFTITIYPPEYTSLPPKKMNDNEGDIYCFEGSKIYFDINSSRELASAQIKVNDNFVNLDVNGDKATGSFAANANGTYQFILKDKEGRVNKNSNIYNIKILATEPPTIVIIEPEAENYELKGEKQILVRARITSDFGFSKLSLAFRKSNSNSTASPNFKTIDIPLQNINATIVEVPYLWSISDLHLSSKDVIEYYMEVTDKSGKSAKTNIRTLKYKSLTDILKESEKNAKDIQVNLKAIYENIKDLQKEFQEFKKDNKSTEELGLNDPKKRDELQNKMNDLQNKMNDAQQKIDQGVNELQQKNELSQKTLEQYMKLQEMFNKINTPQFREMLKKLQDALKKNNPEQFRQELKNNNFDEEAFKKQIEKVLELMKKIENLQKFGELTQKLDDIKKQQEKLKNETENTNKNQNDKLNSLSNQQMDIKDQLQNFKEQLQDLINELSKTKEDVSPENLQKLNDKLNKKKTDSKMQKSSSELLKGEKENSENTQEEVLDDLNELDEDMQNALENAMDTQDMMKKMMEKMKGIKNNLEQLSKDQKDLKDETSDIDKNDKKEFGKKQNEQRGLQQRLSKDVNDLMDLTKSGMQMTPDLGKELGNAYNKMDKASDDLGQNDKQSAMSNQGKAKESLDNAAKMLGDMMKQMEQEGKNGNQKGQGRMSMLMQQLSKLIGMQQGVNGQMQKLGENGKSGKDGKDGNSELSPDAKAEMDRLKIQQEQITKSLEDLNKEFEKEKEKTGDKLLGDLNQVVKEMKEAIKDMSDYNVDDKTIERQNRIVSRMLDAQLSQREKDFEQKRESKPGENYVRTSPPEIVISGPNSINAFKEDFLKLQKEGYTEDYEDLITKYLMELRKNLLNK